MFHLLKMIIWGVGLFVVVSFGLNFFNYEINRNYFTERKDECRERIKDCQEELLHQGLDNAQCELNCVDPKLIIKEKQ